MAKNRQATLVADPADVSTQDQRVAYLLVAAVRCCLDDDRVDFQSLGDLLIEVRDCGEGSQRWIGSQLKRSGRYAERFAAALRNSYSVWLTAEERSALREQLSRTASHEIILSAGPASRFAPNRDMEPSAAADRWKQFWPKKGSAEALAQSESLLRQWLAAPAVIETLTESDAVLTIGGPQWPDRLVTAFQGRGRKPDQQQEGKLPPVPAPRTVEEALSLLEARFPKAELPESKAVALLRSEIVRLRKKTDRIATAKPSARPAAATGVSLSAQEVSRLASLPDRSFFHEFEKLKGSSTPTQLKLLLSAFLKKQAGRDFSEITSDEQRFERKKEFAQHIRLCANFLHCKFLIVDSGQVGNLTAGKGGTSPSGQFQLYRKEAGQRISLLGSVDFPDLALVDA